MTDHQDELAAEKTEGFKVGEKKTLQEYQELGMLSLPFLPANGIWHLYLIYHSSSPPFHYSNVHLHRQG